MKPIYFTHPIDGTRIRLERHHFIGRYLDKDTWQPPFWLDIILSFTLFGLIPIGSFLFAMGMLYLFLENLTGR